ncbi:PTS ascorbate transporter subunit IIC [Lacticaseibacillus sharpeae]|uniref:Ascorbate-specific PTS system EIIC component n=1 Tax=Lacticaseibacillus sharpeae JCM 1186 = DSM 20505 TaxID=1291052 RepID=A0A0R1ZXH4_9LACO|nr:PTS ascorbate transporter subunit IIC [Lacticaseibacillus sharpeae]KRM55795.1 SgaT protein [Lacticaseibacillus sharpeae JCM 1186 = DSM 20505]
MNFLIYFINNVLSQPIFILGLVVIIGMLAEHKPDSKILPSTLKAIIGFTMINVGGQTLGTALLPLQQLIAHIFHMTAPASADIGATQVASLADVGTDMAIIFACGFIINLLLARFTPLKFVHLSPHVSFFFAGLIAALLKFGTGLNFPTRIVVGSILLGLYMTLSCAYVNLLIKPVRGAQGFTLAHSSSSGLLVASILGELFGNKDHDLEDMKLPVKLNFLRDMTVALTLVMMLLFFILGLIAGPSFTMAKVAGGKDIVVFAITKGVEFGMWITVILAGVRMMLAEIIPAFHGIAKRLIPNAKPGLDIPLLFPQYPTSVIVGFLMSLTTGIIGMLLLAAFHYPIIVFPALIPTFFTGAATAIFGDAHGGRRGALLGSGANGFILIFGQAFLLPLVGTYAPIMRILSETDYCVYGPLLGGLLKILHLN